jgi:hypothetical protein
VCIKYDPQAKVLPRSLSFIYRSQEGDPAPPRKDHPHPDECLKENSTCSLEESTLLQMCCSFLGENFRDTKNYRSSSLISTLPPVGPYRSIMSWRLWWS